MDGSTRDKIGTSVVNAALAAGLPALAAASLVLGMTRQRTQVLTIQRTLARVLGEVYAFDRSRPNLLSVQLLIIPTSSPAFLGTIVHRLSTRFIANSGGGVLEAKQATCFECSQYGSFFKPIF